MMPIRWVLGYRVIACLSISFCLVARIWAVDQPRMLGSASCATATCHGGLAGFGPAWHSSSSVWQASDPHSGSGDVLWNHRSQQIVRVLSPTPVTSEEAYIRFLQSQCVSCHAPAAAIAMEASDQQTDWRSVRSSLAEGVSCEACHGPSSMWIGPHTRQDWKLSDKSHDSLGMLVTKTLLERTENCSRCHVGSRSADGLIRDMNHDMIAAGHPPLYFDMVQYQRQLPAHWDATQEKLTTIPATQFTNASTAIRLQVLWAALQLSLERRTAAASIPTPELSEYDCSACHHQLQLRGPRQHRRSLGTALWQPWYTQVLNPPQQPALLRLDQPDAMFLLREVAASAQQQSIQLMSGSESTPRAQLHQLLLEKGPQGDFDFCSVAVWLDQLETTLQAAYASDKNSAELLECSQQIAQFRKTSLGFREQKPSALDRLLPQPPSEVDLKPFVQALVDCLGLDPQGTKP